jgi:hypothetical protein
LFTRCPQPRPTSELLSRRVSTPRTRTTLAWALLVAVGLGLALGVYSWDRRPDATAPAVIPPLPKTPPPSARAPWLGLNYNSGSSTGSLRDFAAHGIVYDREGKLEVRAGTTPRNNREFRSGLATSHRARMIPDIQVDPAIGPRRCPTDPVPTKRCLPTGKRQVEAYVHGFVQTASSVLRRYPHDRVLFEPTDEPWNWAFPPGTGPGKRAAREYASILAQLLPVARAAKVPLSDIYVPATGRLDDGSSWIPDLYEARPCLRPAAGSCGPIAAWNLHPYGLPHSSTAGIDSVTALRAKMLSGQDNIVISEIGFCALDVNNGRACDENRPDIDGISAQTAAWLKETLNEAGRMHRAGWLKALLLWERSGTGWAMQNVDGRLTAQGRVLVRFAASRAAGR